MKKYLMFGLLMFVFTPMFASASTKQITCQYSYPSTLGCDLQKVNFSFTVYDDKVEFNGFKNCTGGTQNGHCYSKDYSGADLYLARGLEKNFLNQAYNKTTKKYSCPNLSYTFASDICVLGVNFGAGEGENRYPLQVKTTEHAENASYPHKKICDYNEKIGGQQTSTAFTIYYEGPSMYSLSVKHNGQVYTTSPSNMDIVTTMSNKIVRVPIQTLNKLYSDFDPNKAYTKCSQKKLYFNDYGEYYTIEEKQGGFTNSGLETPTDSPNNGYEPPNYGGTGDCGSMLGPKTTEYLKKGLTLVQVVGVVLAILLGMADFIGALLSGENDSNKKAMKKFVVRIAVAAILLIVPALLKFILNTFGVANGGMCIL